MQVEVERLVAHAEADEGRHLDEEMEERATDHAGSEALDPPAGHQQQDPGDDAAVIGDGGQGAGGEPLPLHGLGEIGDRARRARADDREQRDTEPREQEVGGRTRGRHDQIRQAWVARVAEVDGRGLGRGEDEAPCREDVEHDGKDHAAERIEVADRIQADPSEIARGRVAELQGRECMRRLVERDGKEDHRQLNGEVDDLLFQAAGL